MMDCQTCQEFISAALDGEASALPVEIVREHLATCLSCREFERAASALQQLLREEPMPAVPDLVERIMAATARNANRRPAMKRPAEPS